MFCLTNASRTRSRTCAPARARTHARRECRVDARSAAAAAVAAAPRARKRLRRAHASHLLRVGVRFDKDKRRVLQLIARHFVSIRAVCVAPALTAPCDVATLCRRHGVRDALDHGCVCVRVCVFVVCLFGSSGVLCVCVCVCRASHPLMSTLRAAIALSMYWRSAGRQCAAAERRSGRARVDAGVFANAVRRRRGAGAGVAAANEQQLIAASGELATLRARYEKKRVSGGGGGGQTTSGRGAADATDAMDGVLTARRGAQEECVQFELDVANATERLAVLGARHKLAQDEIERQRWRTPRAACGAVFVLSADDVCLFVCACVRACVPARCSAQLSRFKDANVVALQVCAIGNCNT